MRISENKPFEEWYIKERWNRNRWWGSARGLTVPQRRNELTGSILTGSPCGGHGKTLHAAKRSATSPLHRLSRGPLLISLVSQGGEGAEVGGAGFSRTLQAPMSWVRAELAQSLPRSPGRSPQREALLQEVLSWGPRTHSDSWCPWRSCPTDYGGLKWLRTCAWSSRGLGWHAHAFWGPCLNGASLTTPLEMFLPLLSSPPHLLSSLSSPSPLSFYISTSISMSTSLSLCLSPCPLPCLCLCLSLRVSPSPPCRAVLGGGAPTGLCPDQHLHPGQNTTTPGPPSQRCSVSLPEVCPFGTKKTDFPSLRAFLFNKMGRCSISKQNPDIDFPVGWSETFSRDKNWGNMLPTDLYQREYDKENSKQKRNDPNRTLKFMKEWSEF